MVTIKSKRALGVIREAGVRLAGLFERLGEVVAPGVSTLAIDQFIERELALLSMVSQTKGYRGYRHVSCISVNQVIVHGVPSAQTLLAPGDLVKVDVCASWKGYCADMARGFFVEPRKPVAVKLMQVVEGALQSAIAAAVVAGRLSDISAAIEKTARENNCAVVEEFCGHGIGRRMHEEPEIPNYGFPGRGITLVAGMVFALEPMVTQHKSDVLVLADGWTACTSDGGLAAHVEDTVIVTDNGPEVVTRVRATS